MGSGASRASPGSRAPRASSRPARTPRPRPPGSTPAARPERRQAAPTRPPPAGTRQLSAVVVRRGGRRVDRREQREAGGGRFLLEIPRGSVWRATFGCHSSNHSKAVMALVDHCNALPSANTQSSGREHNRHCGRERQSERQRAQRSRHRGKAAKGKVERQGKGCTLTDATVLGSAASIAARCAGSMKTHRFCPWTSPFQKDCRPTHTDETTWTHRASSAAAAAAAAAVAAAAAAAVAAAVPGAQCRCAERSLRRQARGSRTDPSTPTAYKC